MLIVFALGLLRMVASVATPCSVKANISAQPVLYPEGITWRDTPLSIKLFESVVEN